MVKPHLSSASPYGADLERSVSVQTEVLRSALMVRREWQRQIETPAFVPCFRSTVARWSAAAGLKLVSFRRVRFPHVGTYSAAYRIAVEITPAQFPYVTEFALVGKSRTQINLSVFGSTSAQTWVAAQTQRLARILVSRIRA